MGEECSTMGDKVNAHRVCWGNLKGKNVLEDLDIEGKGKGKFHPRKGHESPEV